MAEPAGAARAAGAAAARQVARAAVAMMVARQVTRATVAMMVAMVARWVGAVVVAENAGHSLSSLCRLSNEKIPPPALHRRNLN